MTENTRATSPNLDGTIGGSFPILDDGFIRVIDYMGNDAAVVQAARISYGEGTKAVSDDTGLLRYLMRCGHTSPFEQCILKFHIRIPMDAWRQFVRHRTLSINEYSTRYSEAINSMQRTPSDQWRLQAKSNKQGSAGFVDLPEGITLSGAEASLQEHAQNVYQQRLSLGVAREQARKDLPLSTYTEAYVTVDLHNLLHFLKLRLDPHAQKEIREYAQVLSTIVRMWCPITHAAFEDYQMNSTKFSFLEVQAFSVINTYKDGNIPPEVVAGFGLSKRELAEFKVKLQQLGMHVAF